MMKLFKGLARFAIMELVILAITLFYYLIFAVWFFGFGNPDLLGLLSRAHFSLWHWMVFASINIGVHLWLGHEVNRSVRKWII